MKEHLDEAFARYGLPVEVTHGGKTVETGAFVQPMTRETGEEPFSATPLGAVDEHCWRYLGPAAVEIAMGDRICCRAETYLARDAAPFFIGDEVLYYWAVLEKEEESA